MNLEDDTTRVPFEPYVLLLSLELLAIPLREKDNIKGIKALIKEMKINLMADNILTVSDPPTSLNYILDTVN